MRTVGLEGARRRRRNRTTVAYQAAPKAPDLIERDFTATEVNTEYVGDITYLPVSGAKPLYLATVIDLASRRLAGCAIADHMRTELVTDALAARRANLREPGRSGHAHRSRLAIHEQSPRRNLQVGRDPAEHGRSGSSADNAAAESFNTAFNRETLKGRRAWSSEREARLDAFRRLTRYNTRRRHSRLGQRSPIAYENVLRPAATTLTQAA